MKKLPLGIQTFREIINGNYLYVDKTEQLHTLITAGKYFFLSRPRRFGKSLTLSVLKEIYTGSKDLFENLWIYDRWDWGKVHPVIHFSMSSIGYHDLGLENAILKTLDEQAQIYNIQLSSTGVSQRFKELIQKLSVQNGKVVILIDEHDKPLIDYLNKADIEIAKQHQKILKNFYSVIKDSDPYIEFLMITGVSKFSKISIFSDLNRLTDITLHPAHATLTGYTDNELKVYFSDAITNIAQKTGAIRDTLEEEIKAWYNGYSWDGKHFLYNPVSIMSFFSFSGQFRNYWFESGTPTFLIHLINKEQYYNLDFVEANEVTFSSYDIEHISTMAMLFQTGYLTIKENHNYGEYVLSYPNREVRQSLLNYFIGDLRHEDAALSTAIVLQLKRAFEKNDLKQVVRIIKSIFKNIPSHIFIKDKEAYYHSLIYLVFLYLGIYIHAEVNTNDGRLDAVVHTGTHIYVMEFKLDESADAALQQIKEKEYAEKYIGSNKEIVMVGIDFGSEEKSVREWRGEVVG